MPRDGNGRAAALPDRVGVAEIVILSPCHFRVEGSGVMKKTMASIMFVILCAGTVRAGEYWPAAVGQLMNYDNGSTITIEPYGSAGAVNYHEVRAGQNYSTYFTTDADGDTYVLGGAAPGVVTPRVWTAPAPLKFLDVPLFPTKTWSIVYPGQRHVRGRVNHVGTLQMADGVLYYFSVTVTGIDPSVDGTWLVHQAYGPIGMPNGAVLVSVDVTMPIESQAWGAVKALFR